MLLFHVDADLFDGVCYDDGGDGGGGMDFSGDEEAGVSHHSDCGPAASVSIYYVMYHVMKHCVYIQYVYYPSTVSNQFYVLVFTYLMIFVQ